MFSNALKGHYVSNRRWNVSVANVEPAVGHLTVPSPEGAERNLLYSLCRAECCLRCVLFRRFRTRYAGAPPTVTNITVPAGHSNAGIRPL
jgi:hypothetical protein